MPCCTSGVCAWVAATLLLTRTRRVCRTFPDNAVPDNQIGRISPPSLRPGCADAVHPWHTAGAPHRPNAQEVCHARLTPGHRTQGSHSRSAAVPIGGVLVQLAVCRSAGSRPARLGGVVAAGTGFAGKPDATGTAARDGPVGPSRCRPVPAGRSHGGHAHLAIGAASRPAALQGRGPVSGG